MKPHPAPGEILAHGEEQLATATGIARPVLTEARIKSGLVEGKDWGLVQGAVRVTKTALARMLEAMGLAGAVDLEDLAAATDLSAQKKPGPEMVQGKVRKLYLNKHILGVALEDGSLVRCRVKDSARFQTGMAVPLVKEPGSEVYRLGRKEPRSYGRW